MNIIKDDIYKCNILQKEYKKISLILVNIQDIIIQNENILLYSKNQSMKSLNELIKKLNELYNKSIIDIISKDKFSKFSMLQNESMYSDIPDIKSENKSEDSTQDELDICKKKK
jgi:hypothetical protein